MNKTERGFENFGKISFIRVGRFDIPALRPTKYRGGEFIPFNAALTDDRERDAKTVHFFLPDYQFIRVWNCPDKYIPLLSQFKQVLSPDFSTYSDFPTALQLWNHYRKHWVGAYWQAQGIDVIPTISWSTVDSFEWCFDGEPLGSCVAVSSVGALSDDESLELFVSGYREMLRRLEPEQVLFYGKVPFQILGEGPIIQIEPFTKRFDTRRRTHGRSWK